MEDFDYRSILVNSGSIVQWKDPVKCLRIQRAAKVSHLARIARLIFKENVAVFKERELAVCDRLCQTNVTARMHLDLRPLDLLHNRLLLCQQRLHACDELISENTGKDCLVDFTVGRG